MGLLDDGVAMISRTHKATESYAVVYSRKIAGAIVSVNLQARHGRILSSNRQSETGLAVQWGERVYLIEVDDLVLGGLPTTPQRGDRIAEAGEVWELATPDTGDAPWRYSDHSARSVFRCFCKRVP